MGITTYDMVWEKSSFSFLKKMLFAANVYVSAEVRKVWDTFKDVALKWEMGDALKLALYQHGLKA